MVDLIYMGPSDILILKEGGKEIHPGDVVHLSAHDLGTLTLAGERFKHVHDETPPEPEPEPEPAPVHRAHRASSSDDKQTEEPAEHADKAEK